MVSTRMIRAAKAGYLILSALFCAMGVAMLSWPGFSTEMIGGAIGAMLMAFGVVRLVGYFSRDLYRLAFQHDVALGMLAIALGLALIFRRDLAASAPCLVLGVEMITDGLFKIQTALDARHFGLKPWWLILSLAAVAVAAGIWLIVCPFEGGQALVRLTGASLLAQGALGLCVALCAIKIIPHQQPDAVG